MNTLSSGITDDHVHQIHSISSDFSAGVSGLHSSGLDLSIDPNYPLVLIFGNRSLNVSNHDHMPKDRDVLPYLKVMTRSNQKIQEILAHTAQKLTDDHVHQIHSISSDFSAGVSGLHSSGLDLSIDPNHPLIMIFGNRALNVSDNDHMPKDRDVLPYLKAMNRSNQKIQEILAHTE